MTSPWLIYFITGNLYLLTPFAHMTGLLTHADSFTGKCSWFTTSQTIPPAMPTRRSSSKALLNTQTHKTAMPHRAHLTQKEAQARMQSVPAGNIWHSSPAAGHKTIHTYPPAILLSPRWWHRCEAVRLTSGGYGSQPGLEAPCSTETNILWKDPTGVGSMVPTGSCQLQEWLHSGKPRNRAFKLVFIVAPVQIEFTNQGHFYFLLSGVQGNSARKFTKSQMLRPKGKGFC